MSRIFLKKYSPNDTSEEITIQIVECYRDVFADAPWHEWKKCPVCKKYWGKKDRDLLIHWEFRHCDTALVDFWPREQLRIDLNHEITPQASCWLAMDEDRVVGFCWGYPLTAGELEKKLELPFAACLEVGEQQVIAYQDEVGVISSHRGRKLAKAMVAERLDDFLEMGLEVGVVRTRRYPEASITFLWYTQKLGYRILASYPDNDGRVILGRWFDPQLQRLLGSHTFSLT